MSATKFGRHYRFVAVRNSWTGPLEIELPFTMEFDIQRDTLAGINTARITLYNLSEYNRNLLWYDEDTYEVFNYITVKLYAGYGPGPQWPLVFTGQVQQGWSYRQGVDFLSVMVCHDGGIAYQNAVSSATFRAGQDQQVILETIIRDLGQYGVSIGAVTELAGKLAKGVSYSGQTVDILRQITNGNFFIDNLQANVLTAEDVIGGNQVLINGLSGLLGTPLKRNRLVTFTMLFEPRLTAGSTVNLQSSTLLAYNGIYKIVGFHHRGVISAVVSGEAITELEAASGSFNTILQAGGVAG